MSSPVKIPYQSFIQIDRNSSTPIYMQIANQFSNAIQRDFLPKGTKLPGSRLLAELLSVNRNTIVAVYDELTAQGWVETKPNKGTFIIEKEADKPMRFTDDEASYLQTYPSSPGYDFNKSNLLDTPYEHSHSDFLFNDGLPDTRIIQIEQLSSYYSANLKRKSNQKKLRHANYEGNDAFKKSMANYLNLSRGLHVSKDNILITRSTEMSIYVACEILLNQGDNVIVANLSYFSSNMTFQKAGAKILTVPIDKEGIDANAVENMCKKHKIRMLYLTPHHHYPTTVTLSAQRRVQLLQLANKYGFIILEDDYDYDFHYDKSPVLPLASVDTNGMVVYIGSFGKSLAPSFQTGFIVAPESVLVEMQKHLRLIDRQGDILMEQVLGELIEEGEIFRSLKKSIKIYKERRDTFCDLLHQYFGEDVQFDIPSGGLAVWTEWQKPLNLLQLSKKCLQNNLLIPKTLLYQNRELTAMRLGFGHLTKEEMAQCLDILYRVMNE